MRRNIEALKTPFGQNSKLNYKEYDLKRLDDLLDRVNVTYSLVIDEEDVKKKFGALYNAFMYGAPPHAGAAPGFDRMVMLVADSSNIREVIAFPKNKKARDVLMNAPSKVFDKQLKDVHIKLDIEE